MCSSPCASSRSSSTSSNSSTAKTRPYTDLSCTARKILNLLHNTRDLSHAHEYISADVTIQHEDDAPVHSWDDFIRTLDAAPEYRMDIIEACVDDDQNKVWVRSEISGLPGGVIKESIDMMTFDDNGLLVRCLDCQRILGRKRTGDD